jgi:predicted CDP-diglyceride synthetase/phosphatidate cytidylyltransferase
MLLGMNSCKNVQLQSIASAFPSTAKPDSRIKPFYRLIRFQEFDFTMIFFAIVAILCLPRPFTLTLDRSNWQYGKSSMNFLVLAAVYKGISVPLLWVNLGQAGNSSTDDRIKIMQRFLRFIDFSDVHCLLADREFIGEDWFAGSMKIKYHLINAL